MENKAKNTVTFYFSLKVAYRERLYDTKKSQASKRSKSPHLGTFNCTIRAGPALDPPGDAKLTEKRTSIAAVRDTL
jgi:hypothetical protein